MGSVMYTPSGGNSGRSSSSNQSSHRSYGQKTSSVRTTAGVLGTGCILFFSYAAFQFAGIVLGGLGTFGLIAVLVISAGSLAFTTIAIFKAISGRGVRVITIFSVGCMVAGFLVPGLPALIGLVCIGASCCFLLYEGAYAVVSSRAFAVAIVALPLVGALFYVPARIDSAGLMTQFGASSAPSALGASTLPSPIGADLIRIQQAVASSQNNVAVVSYQVRNNRLYADVTKNGTVDSIALASDGLAGTALPWLKWNLSRTLDSRLRSDGAVQLASLVAPSVTTLRGNETVVVADGALLNQSLQSILGSANQRVFRTVSLDVGKIQQNVQQWTNAGPLTPEDFEVVNGLPQNQSDLGALDIPGAEWSAWQSFHQGFSKATPKGVLTNRATKAASLDALKTKKAVVFVVAHADGFSIRFPSGESLDVKDLEAAKSQIGMNHPKVFLFSCETASTKDTQSFAKALLDNGAQAVVAPVNMIKAASALDLFSALFMHTLGPGKLPLADAFQKAMESTGERAMEVWVATTRRLRDMLGPEAA